jgi:hypothetical protein
MREICQSGLEGGGGQTLPTPIIYRYGVVSVRSSGKSFAILTPNSGL